MRQPRSQHHSAWRLPAPALESSIDQAVRQHLSNPETIANALMDADASRIAQTASIIENCAYEKVNLALLDLVSRVDLQAGSVTIALDRLRLADLLETVPDQISLDCLVFSAPFQMRRRGVETKLVIGGQHMHLDETLLRNIAKGHRYFEMILAGRKYFETHDPESY